MYKNERQKTAEKNREQRTNKKETTETTYKEWRREKGWNKRSTRQNKKDWMMRNQRQKTKDIGRTTKNQLERTNDKERTKLNKSEQRTNILTKNSKEKKRNNNFKWQVPCRIHKGGRSSTVIVKNIFPSLKDFDQTHT